MFICEIWLFVWYFPKFCTSDMSKYRSRSVSEGPFDFEITRVDCIFFAENNVRSFCSARAPYIFLGKKWRCFYI